MGAGLLATTSTTTTDVVYVAVIVACGVLGYFFAVLTCRSIGTTPWHLPAITWALLSALLFPWGLMLEMVARLTTRHAGPSANPPLGRPVGFGQARQNVGAFHPTHADTANPAGGPTPWPARVDMRPGPDGWQPAAPGTLDTADAPPLFGWYPDPDGVHQERYWDGRVWSDLVRDGGETSNAPLQPWQGLWTLPAPPDGLDAPVAPSSAGA